MAPDNVTANALATTLCVLPPEEGLQLVKETPGARCLLVAADGRQFRSDGWKGLEAGRAQAFIAARAAAAPKWPAGYQVTITLTLIPPAVAKKIKRPYVAVWIEDSSGNPVRSLTCWGNESKYQKDLTAWWKVAGSNKAVVQAVTRATRAPGRYQLVWDGTDDRGNPVEQGTYTVHVEVHREFGSHVRQTGTIACGGGKASTTLKKTVENEGALVEYGPRGK